jgi:hypothetical protein
MHPYRDDILRRGAPPGGAVPAAQPLAVIRDGPDVQAVCPHCGGSVDLSPVGSSWHTERPIDVAVRLVPQLGPLKREELHVLVLNAKNGVMAQDRIYQGNVSASLVRIGELFKGAVERHGSGLILCHNHPSGDPTPSPDDLHLTAEAIAAGRLLDIPVLDHIIVGGSRFVSLREAGVTFESRTDRHAAEEGGPAWRNPKRGAWKSAVQKHVRRGEVEAAAAAAQALVALPGGRGALARRLPIITAEDVGVTWLPAVAAAVRGASRAEPAPPERLIATAASLAAVSKSKESFWLADTVWDGRHEAPDVSCAGFERALCDGAHQDALAICLQAVGVRAWRSGPRLIDVLRATVADGPDAAASIVTAALQAECRGFEPRLPLHLPTPRRRLDVVLCVKSRPVREIAAGNPLTSSRIRTRYPVSGTAEGPATFCPPPI